jgi:hypothetical protein
MSISGMKYLADLYQIEHRQKALSIPQMNSNVGLNESFKGPQASMVR